MHESTGYVFVVVGKCINFGWSVRRSALIGGMRFHLILLDWIGLAPDRSSGRQEIVGEPPGAGPQEGRGFGS